MHKLCKREICLLFIDWRTVHDATENSYYYYYYYYYMLNCEITPCSGFIDIAVTAHHEELLA